MSSSLLTTVLAAAIAFLTVRPALAGVANTPLPEILPGATTIHLYTVPGVVAAGGLETFFACTSLEASATIQVGVDLFSSLGNVANDPVATSLSVLPGATVYFGTSPAMFIGVDSNLGSSFTRGSARILSTSKKLSCTAFIADPANVPPTSMTYLTIISKLKQKACN